MKKRNPITRWLNRIGKTRWTNISEVLKRAPARFNAKRLKNIKLENISSYERYFQVGLLVLAVFVVSEITGRVIALFIPPVPMEVPQRPAVVAARPKATEDYSSILQRNIFNVEGTIPDPLDQGRMDCFSQARPSSQHMSLLGTIVMNTENFSVALVQEDSNPVKLAVKKDDLFFDGKYQAIKVERKRLCFQVKATQDFEYIEIPDDSSRMGFSSSLISSRGGSDGITPVSENEYTVKKDFLDKQLLNLTEILQTAKAIPYIDQAGKFRGFLVQAMDPSSPFRALGVETGDVLVGVNDIILDNPGKGLEAFQRLRNSPTVNLRVMRGGQEKTISYKVN